MKITSNGLPLQKFSPFPNYIFHDLEEITPEFVKNQGISFLMVDLDNTVASYDEYAPSEPVMHWFEKMKGSGVNLYLISNSTKEERVLSFGKALGVSSIMNARKPSPNGLLRAMGMVGCKAGESGLIGDQIFTDVLAAGRAGVVSILVHPKRFTNPFLALRYFIELPFRREKKKKIKEIASGRG